MLLLRRYYDDRTEGKWIFPDDSYCYNLELKWNNNKVSKSCIPEGTYIVCADDHGRWQWFRFKNVEGRTAIEFHPARDTSQLKGCLSPCMDLNKGITSGCKEALLKFKGWFPKEKQCFQVTIRKWHPSDGKWKE